MVNPRTKSVIQDELDLVQSVVPRLHDVAQLEAALQERQLLEAELVAVG